MQTKEITKSLKKLEAHVQKMKLVSNFNSQNVENRLAKEKSGYVYETPKENAEYLMTCRWFSEEKSIIQVFNIETKIQAATSYHEFEYAEDFAEFARDIGVKYNNALIVIDGNQEGLMAENQLKQIYTNVYSPNGWSKPFRTTKLIKSEIYKHIMGALELTPPIINCPIVLKDIKNSILKDEKFGYASLLFGLALHVLEAESIQHNQESVFQKVLDAVSNKKPKEQKSFKEYIDEGNFFDLKPKGRARVKNYISGLESIDNGSDFFIASARNAGVTTALFNYALYLLRNTQNSFVVFLTDYLGQNNAVYYKLVHMAEGHAHSECGSHYDGNLSLRNDQTDSRIVFTDDLKYLAKIKPTHLIIDPLVGLLNPSSQDFLVKNGILKNDSESSLGFVVPHINGVQKIITGGFGSNFPNLINMEKGRVIMRFKSLTETELNDFEYIDKPKESNKTEITSLRLESNLLSQVKSEAEESGKNVSEYMRTLIERDIKLKKEKSQDRVAKEKFFLNLIKGSVLKFDPDKYPNQTFLFKDEKLIMMSENNCPLVHHKIWDAYEKEFNTSTNEKWVINFIDDMDELSFIMKKVLENYLGLKVGGEPQSGWHIREEEWIEIENWFNKTPLTF